MEGNSVGDGASSSPEAFEESGDSEDVFDVDEAVMGAEELVGADEHDAESCCDGDEGRGFCDARWMEWREWVAECALEGDRSMKEWGGAAESEEEAMAGTSSVDETEANRLFWEACLADGY